MLRSTVPYGKSGGMEVSGTVSGDDSVTGGGVMAQRRLGNPEPTHDSEYVSAGGTSSALVWLTA